MKAALIFFSLFLLEACNSGDSNSSSKLSNFIKPQYSHQQSFFDCRLLPDQNLNAVERFIPFLIEDYKKKAGDSTDEVFVLFPIQDPSIEINDFKMLLDHSDASAIDTMNRSLGELSFSNIANCANQLPLSAIKLNDNFLDSSTAVIEVIQCSFLEDYNYATMKLVFEQLTDALVTHNGEVAITYSQDGSKTPNFQWMNIFPSIAARVSFVESWQSLSISKEIQALLLEQSSCSSSEIFRAYKVI